MFFIAVIYLVTVANYRANLLPMFQYVSEFGTIPIFYDVTRNMYIRKYDKSHQHLFSEHISLLQYLNKQSDTQFVPKLSYINYENYEYGMPNCGQKINEFNKPKDFAKQVKEMCKVLKRHKIYHNDFMMKNVVVNENGKLFLIDWEFISTKKNTRGTYDYCN